MVCSFFHKWTMGEISKRHTAVTDISPEKFKKLRRYPGFSLRIFALERYVLSLSTIYLSPLLWVIFIFSPFVHKHMDMLLLRGVFLKNMEISLLSKFFEIVIGIFCTLF